MINIPISENKYKLKLYREFIGLLSRKYTIDILNILVGKHVVIATGKTFGDFQSELKTMGLKVSTRSIYETLKELIRLKIIVKRKVNKILNSDEKHIAYFFTPSGLHFINKFLVRASDELLMLYNEDLSDLNIPNTVPS